MATSDDRSICRNRNTSLGIYIFAQRTRLELEYLKDLEYLQQLTFLFVVSYYITDMRTGSRPRIVARINVEMH